MALMADISADSRGNAAITACFHCQFVQHAIQCRKFTTIYGDLAFVIDMQNSMQEKPPARIKGRACPYPEKLYFSLGSHLKALNK
jgi:hypothetical protein